MAISETVFDGNGNYARADDGLWRYTATREAVPGARDLLLDEVFPAEDVRVGAARWRRVPRSWLRRRADHPLAWLSTLLTDTAANDASPVIEEDHAVLVSASIWLRHATSVVGMMAPELHPAALLGVQDVATMAGVSATTVRAYLSRHQMPEPVARVGGSPLWTRPIVERWLAARRAGAQGWRA